VFSSPNSQQTTWAPRTLENKPLPPGLYQLKLTIDEGNNQGPISKGLLVSVKPDGKITLTLSSNTNIAPSLKPSPQPSSPASSSSVSPTSPAAVSFKTFCEGARFFPSLITGSRVYVRSNKGKPTDAPGTIVPIAGDLYALDFGGSGLPATLCEKPITQKNLRDGFPVSVTGQGLLATLSETDIQGLPLDIGSVYLPQVKIGPETWFSLRDRASALNIAVRGKLKLTSSQAGRIQFSLETNSNGRLSIDEKSVIEPSTTTRAKYTVGEINLAAGVHDIRVDMRLNAGDRAGVQLNWNLPGKPEAIVPESAFSIE
jgi:hypothetical protein